MTLQLILGIAMRRLDYDLADNITDLNEYESMFRVYLNEGYQIALREFYRPRSTILLTTDEHGCALISGHGIIRVISLFRLDKGMLVRFELEGNGEYIRTNEKNAELEVLCEVECPELIKENDVPRLPEHVHSALADYVCYRHYSNGSIGKQAKAQFYRNNFYERMRTLRPQGMGSVTAYRNLYSATDLV